MTDTRILLPLALAATYLATFGLALTTTPTDRLILAAALGAPLIWLSITDLGRHEIPDLATATIALAGAVFQWHLHGLTEPFFLAILGCVLYFLRYLKVPAARKTIEQKMVAVASVLLIMFNDPFYPITVLKPNGAR